jgi:hypothetical protein
MARPAATPRWARCAATCTSSTGAVWRTRRARSRPREFSGDVGRWGGWKKRTGTAMVRSSAAPHRPRWIEASSLSSHVLRRRCRAASWRWGRFGEAGLQKEVAWWLGAMAAVRFSGPARGGVNRGSRCGGRCNVDGASNSVVTMACSGPVWPG